MILLNSEQKIAAEAKNGVYVTTAGPGSGKTTVIVQRYLNLILSGVPEKDILTLTFTNAAAENMASRAGIVNAKSAFRTFHSFALEFLKKERELLPFRLCDSVIDPGAQYQLIFKLCDRYNLNWERLLELISVWKRERSTPEDAIDSVSSGEEYYVDAYRDYEKECREEGWLDFDSVLSETVDLLDLNPDVKARHQKKYIQVDEAQDTDSMQYDLISLLFGGNLMIIGDPNQCQPSGTKVLTIEGYKNIEELSNEDRVVSWQHSHGAGRLYLSGREIKKASRNYSGPLLTIEDSFGNKTRVTPNHYLWVRFNRSFLKKNKYCVYLMYRKDRGFRIGTSKIRNNANGHALTRRGYQERAEKFWILSLHPNRASAETQEEILSLRFQIPQSIFYRYNGIKLSNVQIKSIFDSAPIEGGLRCLATFGKLFNFPLAQWPSDKLQKFHGFFKTAACNVFSDFMDLPAKKSYKTSKIIKVSTETYRGLVHSLNVEKDHTYVADGIPVGNCIYEWRAAHPQYMSTISRAFPNPKQLYLGTNYRSTGKLVEFFKKILPVDNGIASHLRSANEEGEEVKFIRYSDDYTEAEQVIKSIQDIEKTAILARTNRKLFRFQAVCGAKGIKCKILGKKDLWDQAEIKALMKLLKDEHENDAHTNASDALYKIVRNHRIIEKYRRKRIDPLGSDPIQNINDVCRMSVGKGNTKAFLGYIRKLTYARKSQNFKGLTLSTVHQAKGLEWQNVYLAGVEQGSLPHKDGELAEEKRIFYVGCTRAAKNLTISFSGPRSMFLNDFVDRIQLYESN